MNQLMLSDEILLSVEKPARYIGNEMNCVYKDLSKIDIRYALCFPDTYEIGMSHLGLAILYDFLNKREDTFCERVFSPWVDLDKIMMEKQIPLFGLESQQPIKDFDFIGFTVQYEMCYTNILRTLDLAQIPLFSKDRSDKDPIIMAGGPCTYNPEPIADFIDFFYIGEGEVHLNELMDVYKRMKAQGATKLEYLAEIAKLDCVYVPCFYDVLYKEDGTLLSFTPNHENAKPKVKKVVVTEMTDSSFPAAPLVPFLQPVHDRVVLELFRGCSRGCRFCQAGMVYRPVREKSLEKLEEQAVALINNTGHDEISLISLSSSDYSDLYDLSNNIIDTIGDDRHVNLSLPSLRIDSFSLELMSKVQDVKKSSLTFAPEAGSQRMRDVINKGLSEEDILNGCRQAFLGGWNRVKLYFMLGLPTETFEDIEAIAQLTKQITEIYYEMPKEMRYGKVQIVVSAAYFVPKPFTPFQWMAQDRLDVYLDKQRNLRKMLDSKYVKFNSHDSKTGMLEGVFARGDRRLSAVIHEAYKNGAFYDAWGEHFKYYVWMTAFETIGLDPNFYGTRERDEDELFPWDFIDIGVTKDFLKRENARAKEAKTTPNCMTACSKCGAESFGGGICYED